MKPITFFCQATLPLTPEEIASQILDLSKWPEFNGYGPLPGMADLVLVKASHRSAS